MGAAPAPPTPEAITLAEFQDALGRYGALIDRLSASQGARAGRKTLAELDAYRYGGAVEAFGPGGPGRPMGLDDVKALVEWKLKHGKFRPALMGLVASNDPSALRETVRDALAAYDADAGAGAGAALARLGRLRGVGPATASLLLAVHDPARVAFFADEAFRWLCRGGAAAAPIRYSAAEYAALAAAAARLAARLGVRAVDVERAAFVLMREGPAPAEGGGEGGGAVGEDKSRAPAGDAAAKRKKPGGEPAGRPAPSRRSKRARRSS